jgi:hypothetical protein
MTVIKAFDEDTSAWQTVVVGKQGPAGVVAADLPITYDAGTQTVGWAGDTDDVAEGTTNLYNRVPAAGTAGQVLTKQSGTDYDADWEPGVGPLALETGSYYGPIANALASITLNRAIYTPYYFPVPVVVDAIRCQVTTQAAAGGVVRMGLYGLASGGGPGELIVDAGTAETDTLGIKIVTFTPVTLHGLFYSVAVSQVQTATFRITQTSAAVFYPSLIDTSGLDRTGNVFEVVSGALPSTASPTSVTESGITTQVRGA